MAAKSIKAILVAVFSLSLVLFSGVSNAQHGDHETTTEKHEATEEKLDPAKIILDHIKDAHEFHFFTVGDFHATIPLPVILYSPQRGFTTFMSSEFEHGHKTHDGYAILTEKNIEEWKLDASKIILEMSWP